MQRIDSTKKGYSKLTARTALFIATGFGAGYLPRAPGTWGSLWGIGVAAVVNLFSPGAAISLMAFLIVVAVWSSEVAARHFGQEDPGRVVVDEIAGMALSLWTVPLSVINIIAAFFLFRALDIFKPFPIRQIERRFHGGVGIVMDDLVAGVVTNIVLHIMGSLNVW